jgi:hypothetical protein
MMQNTGLLVANEPVRSRAEVLVGNLERIGVTNALVTCMRPDALAAALGASFDVVLVDAPCSGEGMFRQDETAIMEWSEEHVLSCAARQWQILESAARLLKRGGRLVYSTCTFSREENENAMESFCAAHPDFSLLESRRMYPHSSAGEGQFMAVLVRAGGRSNAAPFTSTVGESDTGLRRSGAKRCNRSAKAMLLRTGGAEPPLRIPRELKNCISFARCARGRSEKRQVPRRIMPSRWLSAGAFERAQSCPATRDRVFSRADVVCDDASPGGVRCRMRTSPSVGFGGVRLL